VAKVIEFYIPNTFRKSMKWVPGGQRGKIIEFASQTKNRPDRRYTCSRHPQLQLLSSFALRTIGTRTQFSQSVLHTCKTY